MRCAQTGDGETVRYHYRSHKTENVEEERVDVYIYREDDLAYLLSQSVQAGTSERV